MEVEEERLRNEEIEGVAIDLDIIQGPSRLIYMASHLFTFLLSE